MIKNLFDFVVQEEAAYQKPIEPVEGWSWGMKEHIRKAALIKNSQFLIDNENRTKRPMVNKVLPLLNIQYRLEGFDVKDIDIYVTNPDSYHKSFLIKKFHEKWALENEIDTFIDNMVVSYVDYGGVLVKNAKSLEVVDLQTIAFADQTDILNGAFAIKHYFAADQLRNMTAWNQDAIEQAITQAEYNKQQDKQNVDSKTPTKYIEVYELHGVFPEDFLESETIAYEASDKDCRQIHIMSFYMDSNGQKQGITFFKKKEPELPFKFLKRDNGIFGRSLGRGGVEELEESQAWTNYGYIRIAHMLDAASKVAFKTTDPQFKNKNNLNDLEDNAVLTLQEGRDINQIDTTPRNLPLFERFVALVEDNANRLASAGDILQGDAPSSGTPFKSVEAQIIENKGMHQYRRGQIAAFLDEIYRDWVIPKLAKEVTKEQTFLSILSSEELQEIAQKVTINKVNKRIKEEVLKGNLVDPQEMEAFKQVMFQDFIRTGRKQFLKILQGEMEGEELDVMTNIAGKQKNLSQLTDKIANYLRQVIATPQLRQDPELVRITNEILESAGMSPITFGITPMLQPQQGGTDALGQLAQANQQVTNA